MEFKPAYIRECLDIGKPITMWMKCHDKTWTASAAEVQQLRALLEQWETDGGMPL
jgi:hypothetical protein